MENKTNTITEDPEILAISLVYNAVKDLENEAQSRVLNFVAKKIKIAIESSESETTSSHNLTEEEIETDINSELEGVSPSGKKWISRNGINTTALSTIFSLGIDEIDLVTSTVPGSKKAQRMRAVFLLKGIAAYLGTGVARFTHEAAKETCLHYDAYDAPNFATIFKSMSAEVAGAKETGYTLTARGLAEATKLIKEMSSSHS